MDSLPEKKPMHRFNHQLAAGILLILIGTAVLLGYWLDISAYTVLLLGLAMLVWGCISHRTGWIIPGGVLTGIGLGILVNEGPWSIPSADFNGVFLLCFALGWFLITILTALFTCAQWWALIPGGIMAVLGGILLATNGAVLWADLNLVYAILLILAGLVLLAVSARRKKNG